MTDVADERPRHRLQPDVRGRFDAHPRDLRPEPVEEAPRPDERQVALRQRAADRHRPHAAERHLAGFEQQGAGAVALGGGLRGDGVVGVESGHRGPQPSEASGRGVGQSTVSPSTSFSLRYLATNGQ